jgi:hypothetical protein
MKHRNHAPIGHSLMFTREKANDTKRAIHHKKNMLTVLHSRVDVKEMKHNKEPKVIKKTYF